MWSDIVTHRVWGQTRPPQGLNKARVKLNKVVSRFVARNGGLVVRHKDLELLDNGLLRPDSAHLNAIDLDIWMLDMEGRSYPYCYAGVVGGTVAVLVQFIRKWMELSGQN